jgi:hypothetical protein
VVLLRHRSIQRPPRFAHLPSLAAVAPGSPPGPTLHHLFSAPGRRASPGRELASWEGSRPGRRWAACTGSGWSSPRSSSTRWASTSSWSAGRFASRRVRPPPPSPSVRLSAPARRSSHRRFAAAGYSGRLYGLRAGSFAGHRNVSKLPLFFCQCSVLSRQVGGSWKFDRPATCLQDLSDSSGGASAGTCLFSLL